MFQSLKTHTVALLLILTVNQPHSAKMICIHFVISYLIYLQLSQPDIWFPNTFFINIGISISLQCTKNSAYLKWKVKKWLATHSITPLMRNTKIQFKSEICLSCWKIYFIQVPWGVVPCVYSSFSSDKIAYTHIAPLQGVHVWNKFWDRIKFF